MSVPAIDPLVATETAATPETALQRRVDERAPLARPLPPRHRSLGRAGRDLFRRAADAGPVRADAAQRLQVAGRLLDQRPAELADGVLHQGPGHLLEPGELPAEAVELHPDRRRGRGRRSADLVAQRLRDRHRPGEGPAVDRRIVPAGQHDSAGGAGLPAVLLRQGGRPLQHQARGDHHLHRHPERLRHLSARLGARHLPQGAARGGRAGRRQHAGRSCGRWSSRSSGRRCRCC